MFCQQCGTQVNANTKFCPQCGQHIGQIQREQSHDQPNDLYAPPQEAQNDVQYTLWNPNATAMWSIIFTPIFSAYLQMKNWQELGCPEEAKQSKIWIGITIPITIFLILLLENSSIPNAPGWIVLLVWYFVNGKKQITFVKENTNNNYKKKGWFIPIIIAIPTMIGVIFTIGMVLTMLE